MPENRLAVELLVALIEALNESPEGVELYGVHSMSPMAPPYVELAFPPAEEDEYVAPHARVRTRTVYLRHHIDLPSARIIYGWSEEARMLFYQVKYPPPPTPLPGLPI